MDTVRGGSTVCLEWEGKESRMVRDAMDEVGVVKALCSKHMENLAGEGEEPRYRNQYNDVLTHEHIRVVLLDGKIELLHLCVTRLRIDLCH